MADCVQNRSRRPGIAVVLRGRLGTGKGVLCTQFGALFGPHFIQVSQPNHLTGNFNSHLKDKLIVYADEAFWAGDKKAEGVLKAMITEDTIQIEMKGKDVLTFRNHIRLLVTSNHEWVVPAGNEERRFFVIDVGDARIKDHIYFGAIVDQ
ncbi:MAG: primase-helicase family protein, partial [Nitrospinota bacterium]